MTNKLIQLTIKGCLFTLRYRHAKVVCSLKSIEAKIAYARKHSLYC